MQIRDRNGPKYLGPARTEFSRPGPGPQPKKWARPAGPQTLPSPQKILPSQNKTNIELNIFHFITILKFLVVHKLYFRIKNLR